MLFRSEDSVETAAAVVAETEAAEAVVIVAVAVAVAVATPRRSGYPAPSSGVS